MATPKILYYPQDARGRLQTIDLGRPLGSLGEVSRVLVSAETALDGGVHVQPISEEVRIRVSLEFPGTGESLWAKLYNLQTHLLRGGVISLAVDPDRAWAGYTQTGYKDESTLFFTRGNTWRYPGLTSAAIPDASLIAIAAPGELPQIATLSAAISSSSTRVQIASPGLLRRLDAAPWLLIRDRDYYPALRLPADILDAAPTLLTSTDDRRIVYALDAELVECTRTIAIMASSSPGVLPDQAGGGTQRIPWEGDWRDRLERGPAVGGRR